MGQGGRRPAGARSGSGPCPRAGCPQGWGWVLSSSVSSASIAWLIVWRSAGSRAVGEVRPLGRALGTEGAGDLTWNS